MIVFLLKIWACIYLGQSDFASAARGIIHRPDEYCKAFLFAETDVSESSFLFKDLLSQVGNCGCRMEWRKREDYSKKYFETRQLQGPIILAATGGPTLEEQESFQKIPEGQTVILLHPSDETISQTDPRLYGNVKLIYRNYFHSQMHASTMDYLLPERTSFGTNSSGILWMPLGLANLRALPEALKVDFLDRPFLWSWAGSTGSKPERSLMLEALKAHKAAQHILQWGSLHPFGSYAGRPVRSQDSMDNWEYSMLMQKTQFIPLPAGISPEQFRIWEAFEAGEVPMHVS